jgi:hypothetical protein
VAKQKSARAHALAYDIDVVAKQYMAPALERLEGELS